VREHTNKSLDVTKVGRPYRTHHKASVRLLVAKRKRFLTVTSHIHALSRFHETVDRLGLKGHFKVFLE